MAVAFSNLGASAAPDIFSTSNASSYATASWTPPTTGMICVFVSSEISTGTPNQPTISGNSLTWTAIKTVVVGLNRLTLFGANASGSTTGATTIDFAAQGQIGCEASFFQATGSDVANGVAQTFVQSPTNSGTAALSGSVTLVAAGNSANRPISGFFHTKNEVVTPRTNWTELDDNGHINPTVALETQFRSDAFETTASASWSTSSDWLGIAAEVKLGVLTRLNTETVTIGNVLLKVTKRSLSETTNILDTILKKAKKILSDSSMILDTRKLLSKKVLNEAMTSIDTIVKLTKRNLSEVSTMVDTVLSVRKLFKTLTDAVTLADSVLKKAKKLATEAVNLADTIVKKPRKAISETVILADVVKKLVKRALSDVISLVDFVSLSKKSFKTLTDSVVLVDSVIKKTKKVITETAVLVDILSRKTFRRISESILLTDNLFKKLKKTLSESLALIDVLNNIRTALTVNKIIDFVSSLLHDRQTFSVFEMVLKAKFTSIVLRTSKYASDAQNKIGWVAEIRKSIKEVSNLKKS